MSILDALEKIQSRPEHQRRQIMYVALGICMVIVFVIWMINFSYTLNSNSAQAAVAGTTISPLDYIRDMFKK